MGDLVGIVLGAGSSVRMGRPKQLLPFGPSTLLAHVVETATAAALDRVLVAVPADRPEIAASLPDGRAEVVPVALDHDPAGHRPGCSTSLQAGLDAVGDGDAVVMLLGDMPGVTTETIDAVVGSWRAEPTWAAVTSYRDGVGHPFVFSAAAFPTLRRLHGDKAVWKIVDREPPSRVRAIAVDHDLPRDIDTPDDYVAVCREHGFEPR